MEDNMLTYHRVHLHVTDSTNRYIRDEASVLWQAAGSTCKALVVTADVQTAGRGQRGNVWLSHAGENLLLSILVRPTFLLAADGFSLSQAVALALRDTLSCYEIGTCLKWPNDIYADNRKIAGILIELDYEADRIEQAIIGIGLNINQTAFEKMDRVPVSMKMLTGRSYDVSSVLDSLMRNFSFHYGRLCGGEQTIISHEYRSSLMGMGQLCSFISSSGVIKAVIEDVTPDGRLVLRAIDGSVTKYAFKEVIMQSPVNE